MILGSKPLCSVIYLDLFRFNSCAFLRFNCLLQRISTTLVITAEAARRSCGVLLSQNSSSHCSYSDKGAVCGFAFSHLRAFAAASSSIKGRPCRCLNSKSQRSASAKFFATCVSMIRLRLADLSSIPSIFSPPFRKRTSTTTRTTRTKGTYGSHNSSVFVHLRVPQNAMRDSIHHAIIIPYSAFILHPSAFILHSSFIIRHSSLAKLSTIA